MLISEREQPFFLVLGIFYRKGTGMGYFRCIRILLMGVPFIQEVAADCTSF